jgi:predicted transcriptional regulator
LNIEEFFAILEDGEWHDINKIADQFQVQTDKLIELSKCLAEKGLIEYEAENCRIKIDPEWKNLLPVNG